MPASFRGIKPAGGGVVVRPPVANVGLRAKYAQKLKQLNNRMLADVIDQIGALYQSHEHIITSTAPVPVDELRVVGDASPADEARKRLEKLFAEWASKYDSEANELADWFTKTADSTTTKTLVSNLKQYVPTVNLQMSDRTRNILAATTIENVGLIKSMPADFFYKVEGSVMRAMTNGRDLGTLKAEIKDAGIDNDKRADFIARDQANKATSVINRARQKDLGIKRATWLHMRGGKQPRESHVAADGQEFDLEEGCLIDGEYIQPGEEPNCGCVAAPIIPAFVMEDET